MNQISHKTFFEIFQIKQKLENQVFIQDVVEAMRDILTRADPNYSHEIWWFKLANYLSKCRKIAAFDIPLFDFEKDADSKPSKEELRRLWMYFFDTFFAIEKGNLNRDCLYDYMKNRGQDLNFTCKLTDSLKLLNGEREIISDLITFSSTGEYDEQDNVVLKFYSTTRNHEFHELIRNLKQRRGVSIIEKENGDWESSDKSVLILSAKNTNMMNYYGTANENFLENQMATFYPIANLLTTIENPKGYSICDGVKTNIFLAEKDHDKSTTCFPAIVRIIQKYIDSDITIQNGTVDVKDQSYTQFLASCILYERNMRCQIMLKDGQYSLVVASKIGGTKNSIEELNEYLKCCQLK